MKNTILKPVKTKHTNASLSGQNYDDVMDLPVTRISTFGHPESASVISVWHVPFWKRMKFLFDGRVNLVCMGKTHAPVSITVGDYFSEHL